MMGTAEGEAVASRTPTRFKTDDGAGKMAMSRLVRSPVDGSILSCGPVTRTLSPFSEVSRIVSEFQVKMWFAVMDPIARERVAGEIANFVGRSEAINQITSTSLGDRFMPCASCTASAQAQLKSQIIASIKGNTEALFGGTGSDYRLFNSFSASDFDRLVNRTTTWARAIGATLSTESAQLLTLEFIDATGELRFDEPSVVSAFRETGLTSPADFEAVDYRLPTAGGQFGYSSSAPIFGQSSFVTANTLAITTPDPAQVTSPSNQAPLVGAETDQKAVVINIYLASNASLNSNLFNAPTITQKCTGANVDAFACRQSMELSEYNGISKADQQQMAEHLAWLNSQLW